MNEASTKMVLSAMSGDYISKTVLIKRLRSDVDDALDQLLGDGFIEGISLSGAEIDHFRLTDKGKRIKAETLALRPAGGRSARKSGQRWNPRRG